MNAESITKLTAGLFDGIKDMKDAKNYSMKPKNQLNLSSDKLYEYPSDSIKEYNDKNKFDFDNMMEDDDEYDEAEEKILEKKFNKEKYDLLPEVKNPLKNFYNEVINEDILKYIKPEKRNKYAKRKFQSSSLPFQTEFNHLVNKVDKKIYKWIEEFKIFDYIVKSGKKYKVASSKNKMDSSKKPTLEKLKYVDKLIKKGKFTEQVIKKFIEKNNMTPKLISAKEIDTMIKPFYEKCLIKAFKRKMKYTRRG